MYLHLPQAEQQPRAKAIGHAFVCAAGMGVAIEANPPVAIERDPKGRPGL